MDRPQPKRVFISYSRETEEHNSGVLSLAARLRSDGIDAQLDRYVVAPPEGWPRWMQLQIEESDFTILVCTPTYKRRFEGREGPGFGRGVTWEGLLANQILYDSSSRNRGFIPVLLHGADENCIPLALKPYTFYKLDESYESLRRHIISQPEIIPPPLAESRLQTISIAPVVSEGIEPKQPALLGVTKTDEPNAETCFSMELLSPLNCEVIHSGVICTKYPEARIWNVEVMEEQKLLNEEGEVRRLQPFVVLVESSTKEAITIVANTDLWLRNAVSSGTKLTANDRIGTLLIPKNNTHHPPFTLSRGVTFAGVLKYRPRITDRFWRSIGSASGRREKYEITEHRLEQDSGVEYIRAPAAGIFEPAAGFHYVPGEPVRRNEAVGYIYEGPQPRQIRSTRDGTLLSTMVGVQEAVYAGQPLLRLRTAPPILDITMNPTHSDTPFWYDFFSPLNGTFNTEPQGDRLASPGVKFPRGTALCRIDGDQTSLRIALDIEGTVMQLFARPGDAVSFGQRLMTVRADSVLIRCPIVGNLYLAPGPGLPPFVTVGSRVRVDGTLCIIEALKLNNEITTDLPGIIDAVMVENGAPVEYGQPLFIIKPLPE